MLQRGRVKLYNMPLDVCDEINSFDSDDMI